MDATPQDNESVVGDECQIISSKPNGPRYDPEFQPEDFDSYSNLILLCRVHHKMIDDQPETFTSDILRQLKANHERWVADALDFATLSDDLFSISSYGDSFQKVKKSMPELIKKMKDDLSKKGNEFIREFYIIGKSWVMNVKEPCFVYFFDDHDNLQGKIHVLENYGFLIDVTPWETKKYRMTEEFVDLLLTS